MATHRDIWRSMVATLTIALTATALPAAERQVQFTGAGGVHLAGTLDIPDGPGPFPAMLLIQGSGPVDRDGNHPPEFVSDLLKQLSHSLATQSIASLRYDKRGQFANVADAPADLPPLEDFVAWNNYVDDARAAFRFLRTQKEIDPARVGIIGHSEGSMIALCIGASPDDHPAALVLLSSPGRPLDQIMNDQLLGILKRQSSTDVTIKFYLASQAQLFQTLRTTGKLPVLLPPILAELYPPYMAKFFAGQLTVDPPALAAKYPGPVFLVAGAADIQESPVRDAGALDTALSQRKPDHHQFILIPNASHNLRILKSPDDPGFSGDVPPDVLTKINTWIAQSMPAAPATP